MFNIRNVSHHCLRTFPRYFQIVTTSWGKNVTKNKNIDRLPVKYFQNFRQKYWEKRSFLSYNIFAVLGSTYLLMKCQNKSNKGKVLNDFLG